ncbi:MAG: hypothetical protein PQJ59_01715 [Spirochaetales bacterium]|nr:hypothetical protein [Spirochaetales bacterium]
MSHGTDLKPATVKIIESIKSKEVRKLLLKGLDPRQTIDGWYYALSLGIWNLQEGKDNG